MPKVRSANPVEQDVKELLDGRVRLYRRRDSGKVWHYRMWVKEAKRYIRKSTGTPAVEEALGIAKDAYYNLIALQRNNLPVIAKTFGELFALALEDEEQKYKSGQLSQSRFEWLERNYNLYGKKFFHNKLVTSITTGVVKEYWKYRMSFWDRPDAEKLRKQLRVSRITKNPKGSTLNMERRIIEMTLSKAVDLNYLSAQQLPDTAPPLKSTNDRRPALTKDQWEKVESFMCDVYRYETGSHVSDSKRRLRTLLYYYCLTMVNTGMRVMDMRNLKWENLTLHADDRGNVSTLLQVYGKNNQRDVIAYAPLYRRLQEWRADKLNEFTEDGDYVFTNYDRKPLRDMGFAFTTMMKNAEATDGYKGVSTDYMGDKITIYSMRHTYATLQVQYIGTSYDDLSKNMGTSAKMLRLHYDHVKNTDIAQRLNKMPGTNKKTTPIIMREMNEKKLVRVLFGKTVQEDPMFKLLDGQIDKDEYKVQKGK